MGKAKKISSKEQLQAEADFWDKTDYEGGSFEALFGYGLKPDDYNLAQADKDALNAAIAVIKPQAAIIDKILARFEKTSEKLHADEE